MTVQGVAPASCATSDIRWLPSPLRPTRTKRPQATHRDLTADDFRHGIDRIVTSPSRPGRRRLARPPELETIFEERKLRTKRVELDDPEVGSNLRFSATYCPRSLTSSVFEGLPFLWQQEHLENFAILAGWRGTFVNVTRSFSRDKVEGMRSYALGLYREAFARGQLR